MLRKFVTKLVIVVMCSPLTSGQDLKSLLENSPFGSVADTPSTPKEEKPLEFRGVFAQGEIYFFNLYITAISRSEWLGMEEAYGDDLTIKDYDSRNQQLTVEYRGKILNLSLGSTKRTASSYLIAQSIASTGAPAPIPSTQPALPVSEQERLGKVADEIRRRRALQQQALRKKI